MSIREERRRRIEQKRLSDPTSVDIGFDDVDDEENIYAQTVDAGHKRDERAQKILITCIVLFVVFIVGLIFPKNLLDWDVVTMGLTNGYTLFPTVAEFVQAFQDNVASLLATFSGTSSGRENTIVRYCVIAMAGAGLALSGAVYQGSFRNSLVSPSSLGVMTGGHVGMTVWVIIACATAGDNAVTLALVSAEGDGTYSITDYIATSYGLAICSFIGCFLVVGLVLLVMFISGKGGESGIMLIITGQIISAVASQFNQIVRYYYVTLDPYSDAAQLLQELQVSSFYRTFTWIDLLCIGIPLAITAVVVIRMRNKMMALAFDKSEQRTMGVDTKVINVAVVGLCTLLTAIIISFCGTVSYVGFLIPHLARRMVGPNFKYLLPASMALGAVFVLAAYVLMEITVGVDYASLTGIFISIAGSVVFVFTAIGGKGTANGTFLR